MAAADEMKLPRWSIWLPPVVLVALALTWGRHLEGALLVFECVALIAAITVAVHHAEVVAHRVGEPYGTLILAVGVTVIEVGLIVTLMVSSPDKTATLARDTVFSAFMIAGNGVVGICLLLGALKHQVLTFRPEGVAGAVATLAAVATLSLVLPTFTTSSPGPTFSGAQLVFAGLASLFLYGTFVLVQTVRHREYFLPIDDAGTPDDPDDDHLVLPSNRTTWLSLGLMLASLAAVVGLAKAVSPAIEDGVRTIGAPQAAVGVVIALLVLAPETVAAVRAALHNRIQTSLNLALGSALASIGLTIPAIGLASIWLSGPLELGLGPKDMVLLTLTVVLSTLTTVMGRATVLQGAVHLSVFGAFIFLAVTP
ncbi:calcium:proton antiporter [Angustibacter sp. McL0619]|uniref:calcium:proton antiporter n=1 Tax=Angustibacter sp. McL0619 TaxID=3415676 RepID=UPI003CE7D18D